MGKKAISHQNTFKERTDKIISENENLLQQVRDLLQGATAGRLYEEFKSESNKMKSELFWWLMGVIVINIILVSFSILIINGSNSLGIKPLDLNDFNPTDFLKLFLTLPILLLDIFIINQYNSRKALMDKYTFKSLISISLIQYNDLIKQHKDRAEDTDFIIRSIDKIYSSPFDEAKLTRGEKQILNDILIKGVDTAEKAANKIIDKVNLA